MNDVWLRCEDSALIETLVWGPGTPVPPWLLAQPGGHTTYTITEDSIDIYISANPIIVHQTREEITSTSSPDITTHTTGPAPGKTPTWTLSHTTTVPISSGSIASPTGASSQASISIGTKAGIGVGVSIAGIILIGVLFWLLRRHRKGNQGALDHPESAHFDDGHYTGKPELSAIETNRTTRPEVIPDQHVGETTHSGPHLLSQPYRPDYGSAAHTSELETHETPYRTQMDNIPKQPELESQPPRSELHGNPRAELPGSGWHHQPPEVRTLKTRSAVL